MSGKSDRLLIRHPYPAIVWKLTVTVPIVRRKKGFHAGWPAGSW